MQITSHIHALKVPFQLTISSERKIERFVYVYLIYGKNICLIDSGVAGSESVIFDDIRNTGRKPEEISLLVQTHAHPDHIGATQAIKRTTRCIVAAHEGDRPWIEDVELQFRERPVPSFPLLVGGSVKVDRILEEGDVLEAGNGLKLEVFHTPGHSKGSITLLLREEGALFSGDVIPLPGDVPIYDDVLAAVGSIKKLKAVSGIHVLLSSWDDPLEGNAAYQRMEESLLYLQRIHEAVIKIAAGDVPLEPMELCRRVLTELGMPPAAANPLVARSFQANLAVLDHRDLLSPLLQVRD